MISQASYLIGAALCFAPIVLACAIALWSTRSTSPTTTPTNLKRMEHPMSALDFTIVNPDAYEHPNAAYLLHFGSIGTAYLLAYAGSFSDALDECVDWIADNAPHLLANEQVEQEFYHGVAMGLSDSDAHEYATQDTTCAGNRGDYLHSWEWGISQTSEGGELDLREFSMEARLAYAFPHIDAAHRQDYLRGLFPNALPNPW